MLSHVNMLADAVICIGSMWVVLTSKVDTRTGASISLMVIGIGALFDLISKVPHTYGIPETMMKTGVAALVAYAWYRIEVRHLIRKRIGV